MYYRSLTSADGLQIQFVGRDCWQTVEGKERAIAIPRQRYYHQNETQIVRDISYLFPLETCLSVKTVMLAWPTDLQDEQILDTIRIRRIP